ncbi:mas-related G-protein coupled receptor member H-like [Mercenaria mercenaria]|uniref:mas-related G-protein coupled receptor member H-like n=1 Tax=Mercenaria mercenaria TaxID=6596 RepID=UPI00234F1AC8|nr:mas-related G-protein coupled receptor member H-like [Mercenaria mercenaria]XP_045189577.2 mas-related G-protein coupled receptor member H-like [Mercenaria mercenaria]XP_045189578.2 mas-related G-protein coupled receptor member H-like [Mercenaria mercenaria]XP_053407215.1 mas-related G-protein coupled receptor member H-like [Mercenaria mercenaria]
MMTLSNNSSLFPETNNRTLYMEHTIAVYVWTFVPPLIITLGTVGNLTTIIVYARPSMRSSAFAIYAVALAISDTVALYSGMLFDWLMLAFDVNISFRSSFGCKIVCWLVYTSVCYSAWIITAITVERVALVWFPLWSRRRNDKKFSKKLIVSIFVFCMLLNSHLLYGIVLDTRQSIFHRKCNTVDESYQIFFQHVWPWITSNVFCFVPCFLIITCNMMIIFKMLKGPNYTCRSYRPNPFSPRNICMKDQRTVIILPLLLTLNTVFLITTLPLNIYLLILKFTDVLVSDVYSKKETQNYLCWTILNMLLFSNNAVNCIFYCLSGSNFRKELKAMCCNKGFH